MDTSISPAAYCREDLFRAEQSKLFGQIWVFAGLKRDLENHHDFITCQVGESPLLVQNFHGQLRAYLNVCSHRFSQIHSDPCGNRPLQCPYHGWAYNVEGVPVGIPDRPRFDDLTPERINELRLQRWQVETAGELVFVARPEVTLTLTDYLGPVYAQAVQWSSAFGLLIEKRETEFQANWKIVVENTLEAYHVPLVHPESLNWFSPSPGDNVLEGIHSSFTRSVTDLVSKDFAKLSRLFDQRPVKLPGYQHLLIFPNLTLATTWGASFSLQSIEPVNVSLTRMRRYVFVSRVGENVPDNWLISFGQSVAQRNCTIFEEDRIACEAVQRGVAAANGPGILSDEESRVGAFHQEYRKFIGM